MVPLSNGARYVSHIEDLMDKGQMILDQTIKPHRWVDGGRWFGWQMMCDVVFFHQNLTTSVVVTISSVSSNDIWKKRWWKLQVYINQDQWFFPHWFSFRCTLFWHNMFEMTKIFRSDLQADLQVIDDLKVRAESRGLAKKECLEDVDARNGWFPRFNSRNIHILTDTTITWLKKVRRDST